jgi:DNA-binding phage protein
MLSGDIATAKTILRDYINATMGFAKVAEHTHIPPKSLMRMLGPAGNPRADNLFEVVSFLQQGEGVRFHVRAAAVWGCFLVRVGCMPLDLSFTRRFMPGAIAPKFLITVTRNFQSTSGASCGFAMTSRNDLKGFLVTLNSRDHRNHCL